jgi:hypothetical protein
LQQGTRRRSARLVTHENDVPDRSIRRRRRRAARALYVLVALAAACDPHASIGGSKASVLQPPKTISVIDEDCWCYVGSNTHNLIVCPPGQGRIIEDCTDEAKICEDGAAGPFCVFPGGGEGGGGGGGGDPCDGVDYFGYCAHSTAIWCEDGALRELDCAASGDYTCGWDGGYLGNTCLPTGGDGESSGDGCHGVDYAGYCTPDSVAVWCEGGQIMKYDCAGDGNRCGWDQVGDLGNTCLSD